MNKGTNKQLAPLCFMPDGHLVCYQFGDIVILKDCIEVRRITIFDNKRERFLGRYKFPYRLLRLGIRAAEVIDKDHIVLSVSNMIYELNILTGEMSNGFFCGEGIRPLIFSKVEQIRGFEDGLYFGEYLSNMEKRPVSVYHRKGVDQWEVVYTFPHGCINHIHNIVSDSYRNCLWAFTGDFDEASAIWKITENFRKVERVACNNQKYRGCVVFVLPEGLLYATDAPYADNFVYLLNTDSIECHEVFPIDGSCIYGCQWKNKYVFSSTVEGDGRNMSRREWLFTRKRGAGIKDNYIHMYIGELKEGFKEIHKERKDRMPYYTFQFGVFRFPYGVNNTDTLYYQPIATQKHDLDLMTIPEL